MSVLHTSPCRELVIPFLVQMKLVELAIPLQKSDWALVNGTQDGLEFNPLTAAPCLQLSSYYSFKEADSGRPSKLYLLKICGA